jgi:hypothetical protein
MCKSDKFFVVLFFTLLFCLGAFIGTLFESPHEIQSKCLQKGFIDGKKTSDGIYCFKKGELGQDIIEKLK